MPAVLLPRQRRELSQAAATFLLLMVSELDKDTDPGHLTNSSVSSRGQPLSQELEGSRDEWGPADSSAAIGESPREAGSS